MVMLLGVPSVFSTGDFWIGVAAATAIAVLLCLAALRSRPSTMTVSVPFGLGSVTYDLSAQDRVIAWRMYVQLTTRKAALPLDDEHDVVADVYGSLYELFSVARDILSSMNQSDISRRKGVADVILRTLNDGLRPHLTRWHASFRRWWELQLADESNSHQTPQELQKQFPRFDELLADLKRTNTELSRFADELLAIARAERRKPKKGRPTPEAPVVATPSADIVPPSVETPPSTPYDGAAESRLNNRVSSES